MPLQKLAEKRATPAPGGGHDARRIGDHRSTG
jgi:hypothetical protein